MHNEVDKGAQGMLYGNEYIRKKIQNEVAVCEAEWGIKVIYGAVIGSISRGLQYMDSDYDIRFLYVKQGFPQKIIEPDRTAEKEMIYRKPFTGELFESIPFWEFSSFMRFLVNPCIDYKFSTGLYNVVGLTILSPYSYDPHGIRMKILPLIQKMFHKEYYISYHKESLGKLSLSGENVVAKDYLYALHTALSISWANKYNEYPPVHIKTLLAEQQGMYDEVCRLMDDYQNEAARYVIQNGCRELQQSHSKIMTGHVAVIDEYLEMTKRKLEFFEERGLTEQEKAGHMEIIDKIYKIVAASIYSETKVNGIN